MACGFRVWSWLPVAFAEHPRSLGSLEPTLGVAGGVLCTRLWGQSPCSSCPRGHRARLSLGHRVASPVPMPTGILRPLNSPPPGRTYLRVAQSLCLPRCLTSLALTASAAAARFWAEALLPRAFGKHLSPLLGLEDGSFSTVFEGRFTQQSHQEMHEKCRHWQSGDPGGLSSVRTGSSFATRSGPITARRPGARVCCGLTNRLGSWQKRRQPLQIMGGCLLLLWGVYRVGLQAAWRPHVGRPPRCPGTTQPSSQRVLQGCVQYRHSKQSCVQ